MASRQRVSEYKVRFHRTIGKALDADGTLRPKRFLLGTDRAAAEVASRLLEKLWDEVLAEYDGAAACVREGRRLGDSNRITGRTDVHRMREVHHGPAWREVSLMIAEAIRHGEREIPVEVGADSAVAYVQRIQFLRQAYSVIAFVPADPAWYGRGQEVAAAQAKQLVDDAEECSALAQCPLPAATGQTLYQALEAYGKFATQKNPKEAGRHEAACAERLKASHPDVPLEKFGVTSLERIAAYWSARPKQKRTRKPVALSTITNHLKVDRAPNCQLYGSPEEALAELREDIAALGRDVKELAADIARGPLPGHEAWLERVLANAPEVPK